MSEWKKVVLLHPLSTGKGEFRKNERGSDRTLKRMKDRDSVCPQRRARGAVQDTRVKVTERNSYNEEFDPGSG